eukprot:8866765-Karenia_brevis.AAC.1
MYGGGLRSLEHLSPAAFSATICRTVPQMVDSRNERGEHRSSFLNVLVPLLGAGSFDEVASAR